MSEADSGDWFRGGDLIPLDYIPVSWVGAAVPGGVSSHPTVTGPYITGQPVAQ